MAREVGGIKAFTVKDICELLNVTPQSVRKYLKSGDIKARKIGAKWIVTEEAIRAFMNGEKPEAKKEYKEEEEG